MIVPFDLSSQEQHDVQVDRDEIVVAEPNVSEAGSATFLWPTNSFLGR